MSGLKMFKRWLTGYDIKEEMMKPLGDDEVLGGFLDSADFLSVNLSEEGFKKLVGAVCHC